MKIGSLIAMLLLVPSAGVAADVYYPEYKRNPVPPVVVVDDIVKEDDGIGPACIPAAADCDDPAAPPAVAAHATSREATTAATLAGPRPNAFGAKVAFAETPVE